MSGKYDIEKVAELAHLRLDDKEKQELGHQLEKIVKHFSDLGQISTDGVAPLVTPHEGKRPLRQDVVEKKVPQDRILELAPDIKDSQYRVPPVV